MPSGNTHKTFVPISGGGVINPAGVFVSKKLSVDMPEASVLL